MTPSFWRSLTLTLTNAEFAMHDWVSGRMLETPIKQRSIRQHRDFAAEVISHTAKKLDIWENSCCYETWYLCILGHTRTITKILRGTELKIVRDPDICLQHTIITIGGRQKRRPLHHTYPIESIRQVMVCSHFVLRMTSNGQFNSRANILIWYGWSLGHCMTRKTTK